MQLILVQTFTCTLFPKTLIFAPQQFLVYTDVFRILQQVGGEKMYEKARRGESIELSPRRISIFQFDIERSLEDR